MLFSPYVTPNQCLFGFRLFTITPIMSKMNEFVYVQTNFIILDNHHPTRPFISGKGLGTFQYTVFDYVHHQDTKTQRKAKRFLTFVTWWLGGK